MNWIQSSLTVLMKDVRIELRTRFAFNLVLAFVVASLLLIIFTLRAQDLNPTPKSGLIWIIILFAALSSLGRSFISETDKHTYDLLRLYGRGSCVFAGKMAYNLIFSLGINILTFVLYVFLVNITVLSWTAFATVLFLGTMGLSGVSTMVAAIVSQADRKGAIFSVLSIPLFIPLILLLTRVTKAAFVNGMQDGFTNDLAALTGFIGVTITAGVLLFDYIWEES